MRIEVYLDGASEPFDTLEPPEKLKLDTTKLADGPHVLLFKATDEHGSTSIREIPFSVQNGPAIAVHGIRNNDILHDQVSILANAYSSNVGDTFEPMRIETPRPIPTWAWLNVLIVFAWGMWYLGVEYHEHKAELAASAAEVSAAQPAGAEKWSALGEQVYGNNCAACHQASGVGLPGVFPPLKGNKVVTAEDPSEHIRIIMDGLQDKAIDGVDYSSPMPAFGTQLSHEEIAAVVNHERSHWGNHAATVTAEQVEKLASGVSIQVEKSLEASPVTTAPTVVPVSNKEASNWDWKALGAKVYGDRCGSCHQPSGTGLPGVFPPLKGNAVVTAEDPAEHIRAILDGVSGKTIDGIAYASPMPAFATQLSDEEVAAVVNHERSNWDNQAPTVTTDQVHAIRQTND